MGVSVTDKLNDAKRHGDLHLSCYNLARCPPNVFTSAELTKTLWRLDLSCNLLTTLPDAISSLIALQVLWVNENPRLTQLPPGLAKCKLLRVIDASSTALDTLPSDLARLENLHVLDITDTPLEKRWIEKKHLPLLEDSTNQIALPYTATAQQEMCQRILHKLKRKDERTRLKLELFDKLYDQVYRMERSNISGCDLLRLTIRRLMKQFPLADEIRSITRNAERFFPASFSTQALAAVDASEFRRAFDRLHEENERKKRAADLEIKIRNLYFDRIDPRAVEPMVKSIYEEIHDLSDVKFLLKHASALFPKDSKDVDGKEIKRRLAALQEEQARERAMAIDKLLIALKSIYSDVEPAQLHDVVSRVTALFKVVSSNIGLTRDIAHIFLTL
ncbi:hypothetical protein Poli38472_003329 [Pythium oligandrum]|uniref:Uncharacterized protein n=1 Tax=Pythium oligandrum TaxID=41045 RepID=A0A8K1FDY8_PYTOL|nr:hypothetical protein Poli38472_003329 [Pythium oligandrum]|eukprot:TMW57404.1 hypothetical protein Poli38472_003329 [Pythium oligandrum]